MKVTFVPEQIVLLGFAVILKFAATFGLTTIVIAFEATGFGLAQEATDVITQVITFPFVSPVVV